MDGRKILLDFIVVKEEDMNKLLDVNVFIAAGEENLELSFSSM